ncbi:TOMM precursor leader peptide-binding protein [Actinosynnema sp. NPDC004786]
MHVRVSGPPLLHATLAAFRHGDPEPTAPWLPVHVDGPVVLIGPVVLPATPGCDTCARRRRDHNRADRLGLAAWRAEFGDDPPTPLVTTVSAHAIADVVADELHRLTRPGGRPRTRNAVLRWSPHTGLLTRHAFLPDPLCPRCADLPDDTAQAARLHRRPLPKPDPGTFRTASLNGRWTELERSYVDPETGLIGTCANGSPHGIPTATARLGPPHLESATRHGYGRAADFRTARLTAITEALERYGNPHPRGRRTAVLASYDQVADRAIDPRDLGLYPDDWYDRPGFPFARFNPGAELAWVWAHSFRRAEPVLVPRSHAYYGRRPGAPDRRLAYECSNGCALGGSPEEAILHGLLEIAERDAFLMTWYARLPAPRLDLGSARDRRIPVLAEFVRQRLGYAVTAYSTTLEQRVPAVLVLAVDAERRPGVPRHGCGAAAHPDPERALHAALIDAAAGVGRRMAGFDLDRAARLLADPDEVREMPDHALLHGHPGTAPRLSFLDHDRPPMPLADLAAHAAWPRHHDLGDDLAELVRRYLDTGLDVLAVDTTTPEHRACGFASAKVIVPGTLPMTFGHGFRRTHGIPRLASVPRLLGHRATDLPPEDVNPHPHPFP